MTRCWSGCSEGLRRGLTQSRGDTVNTSHSIPPGMHNLQKDIYCALQINTHRRSETPACCVCLKCHSDEAREICPIRHKSQLHPQTSIIQNEKREFNKTKRESGDSGGSETARLFLGLKVEFRCSKAGWIVYERGWITTVGSGVQEGLAQEAQLSELLKYDDELCAKLYLST